MATVRSGGAHALHAEGVAHQRAGRLERALACYRAAVALDPQLVAARYNAAVALQGLGRAVEAITAYRELLTDQPSHAGALNNLGLLLAGRGNVEEAITAYRAALSARPDFDLARLNLANALAAAGELAQAEALYRTIVAANPNRADVLNNLGSLFAGQMRVEDAIDCFRRALALDASLAAGHTNLGAALALLGRLDEARVSLARALALRPDDPDALAAAGNVALADLALADARLAYDRGLAVRPEHAGARLGRALVRLLLGDLAAGWADYEARLPVAAPGLVPRWDGRMLERGVLLLHAEQGLGDTLQFLRYVPMVCERTPDVVLEVQPAIVPLLGRRFGEATVIAAGTERPPHAARCPLLSLPGVFGTTLATVPGAVPYLAVDPRRAAAWAHRLAPRDALRVGLVWAGNPGHRNDRNRSLAPELLAPLAAVEGVRWYSLQKSADTFARLPADLRAVDLAPLLGDFADTAAALAHLDLLISVDTSVAHLAGAHGREAWVLLPFAPDWRWLLDRDDSPWYPSLRLFRQPHRGAWERVIASVAEALFVRSARGA